MIKIEDKEIDASFAMRDACIDFIAGKRYNIVRILLSIILGGVVMNIRPSAAIRQNYNEIADMCRKTAEPVFLTKKWGGRSGSHGYRNF